jgi:hypothetical protein
MKMKIKITKKHKNTNVWFNDYLNKEFEVLSISAVGRIVVALPNLDFRLPVLLLVWHKKRRYTKGVVLKGYYEIVI